jgi:hypothetical protein
VHAVARKYIPKQDAIARRIAEHFGQPRPFLKDLEAALREFKSKGNDEEYSVAEQILVG